MSHLSFFEYVIRKDLSNEEIIGISEQMEVIREVDMGEETGMCGVIGTGR